MRKRNPLRLYFVTSFALAMLAGGCDGDLTALEGVYEIQTWSVNEVGCDTDGDSVLEERTDDHFYLKAENLFGQEFLNLVLCEGLETCLVTAAEDTINLGFGLDSGSDGAGWTGSGYTLGGSDTCSGEVRSNSLIETTGGQLRFEIRRTFVEDVPLDGEGFCDSDAAIAAAESQGCEGIEVTTAMQVSDL